MWCRRADRHLHSEVHRISRFLAHTHLVVVHPGVVGSARVEEHLEGEVLRRHLGVVLRT
jgi:hypothetical protein